MDFSARSAALGYFYQARYALYLLLNAERDETEIALEKLDDISFEANGTPLELLQTKHHINRAATLTNASVDLWKTLRIWSLKLSAGEFDKDTLLTLVTTASAPNDELSITKKLKPDPKRDNEHIAQELVKVAQLHRATNTELKTSFDAFLALNSQEQLRLVSAIQILDNSPDIVDTLSKIKSKLLIRPQFRDALLDRIEGWWFAQVVRHLISNSSSTIKKLELINVIADTAEQFRPDSLPIDYAGVEPPEKPDPQNDGRRFVDQLRMIALQNKQIANAIRDYYRAFEQRSRWEREQLLNIGELDAYERRLIDEWQRESLWREFDENDEDDMKRCGRELFHWAEQADLPIRHHVTEPYVMRGSFHMLANQTEPSIYWHPKFVERLKQLVVLPEPTTTWEKRPTEIQNLFNPAFCSHLLHSTIKSYYGEKREGMPFALLFLVLPVILHRQTRVSLPRSVSTKLHVWLGKNPETRVGFAQRARDLVSITKTALYFGIDKGYIALSGADKFIVTGKAFRSTNDLAFENTDTTEITEIKRRAPFVGRWYAQAGSVPAIYVMWGIRP